MVFNNVMMRIKWSWWHCSFRGIERCDKWMHWGNRWVDCENSKAVKEGSWIIHSQSFYSQKWYYAVNVQAIVDKNKKILFRSIMSRGAEHHSSAFKNSSLYKWLIANWVSLAKKGYYFIGNSAYALKSFLLTPYDNAEHGTVEDNYNFFHSSSRIAVECCFREIDLQWGISWRELS